MSSAPLNPCAFITPTLAQSSHFFSLPEQTPGILGPYGDYTLPAVPGSRPAHQSEDDMNAKTRRTIEMGKRALEFSRAHSDGSPGYAAALARLEDRLARADQLATQQRDGILESRAATARKRDLRRTMKQAHLGHVASVAELASREEPELAQKFVLPRRANSYLAFRTAARGMEAEAENRKELLVRHGLSEPVLQALAIALDQFDTVVEQGSHARLAHVGASAELDTVADEVIQVVKVMDGLNRFRFGNDPESLAAWESASNTVATPRPTPETVSPETQPPAGGEVRPAA
jgi:hypothetical protein